MPVDEMEEPMEMYLVGEDGKKVPIKGFEDIEIKIDPVETVPAAKKFDISVAIAVAFNKVKMIDMLKCLLFRGWINKRKRRYKQLERAARLMERRTFTFTPPMPAKWIVLSEDIFVEK